MSRLTRFLPVLLVLAAFLTAQGGAWIHHAGHAAKDATHDAGQACPHGMSDIHFCDPAAPHGHADDCAICTSIASRRHTESSLSLLCVARAADLVAASASIDFLPRMAPEAVLSAPRGPPA